MDFGTSGPVSEDSCRHEVHRVGLGLGKNAAKWTRPSCRRFEDNLVRLQPFAMTYKPANFLRQLELPRRMRTRTLTTLDAEGEADQDRREGGASRLGDDFADGRGGSAPGTVRGVPGSDWSTLCHAMARMIGHGILIAFSRVGNRGHGAP